MHRISATPDQLQETIGRLTYFHDWTAAQLHNIVADAHILAVPKHHLLIQKGKPLEHLYILISGEFRFFIPVTSGDERVVGILGPGSSFGEACLELGIACPYSGIAAQSSHLLAIGAKTFLQEVHASRHLLHKTLTLFAQRLMGVMSDVEISAQHTSLERVACYLSKFQPNPHTEDFSVPLTGRKKDIAARIGLTAETFSRILAQLEQAEIIQSKGRELRVINASKLGLFQPPDCVEK